jgi:hypothetical protein
MDRGKLDLLGVGLAVCLAFSGCQWRQDASSTAGADLMRADWGVVLPAQEQAKLLESCARPTPSGLSGQWSPSQSDIDRLERRLPSIVGNALARVVLEKGETLPRPSDYYRQYGGFRRDGRRVIYICGLHRGLVQIAQKSLDQHAWKRRAMGADDGGLAVLGILYDVDRDEFGPVQFEGRVSGPVRSRWF